MRRPLHDSLAADKILLRHRQLQAVIGQTRDRRPPLWERQLLAQLEHPLGQLNGDEIRIRLLLQLQAGGRILERAHSARVRLIAVGLRQHADAQEHLARIDEPAVRAADGAADNCLRCLLQIAALQLDGKRQLGGEQLHAAGFIRVQAARAEISRHEQTPGPAGLALQFRLGIADEGTGSVRHTVRYDQLLRLLLCKRQMRRAAQAGFLFLFKCKLHSLNSLYVL